MSVTLNTQLEDLMFSSQIPDLDLTTSDDNEAVVSIVSGGATVFLATQFLSDFSSVPLKINNGNVSYL
jgi:hypothetical protein